MLLQHVVGPVAPVLDGPEEGPGDLYHHLDLTETEVLVPLEHTYEGLIAQNTRPPSRHRVFGRHLEGILRQLELTPQSERQSLKGAIPVEGQRVPYQGVFFDVCSPAPDEDLFLYCDASRSDDWLTKENCRSTCGLGFALVTRDRQLICCGMIGLFFVSTPEQEEGRKFINANHELMSAIVAFNLTKSLSPGRKFLISDNQGAVANLNKGLFRDRSDWTAGWVKGHANNIFNYLADALARNARLDAITIYEGLGVDTSTKDLLTAQYDFALMTERELKYHYQRSRAKNQIKLKAYKARIKEYPLRRKVERRLDGPVRLSLSIEPNLDLKANAWSWAMVLSSTGYQDLIFKGDVRQINGRGILGCIEYSALNIFLKHMAGRKAFRRTSKTVLSLPFEGFGNFLFAEQPVDGRSSELRETMMNNLTGFLGTMPQFQLSVRPPVKTHDFHQSIDAIAQAYIGVG